MGLSDGRKSFAIGLAVLIQYRSVTASHPASHPASHVAVAITLYAKASSLKMELLHRKTPEFIAPDVWPPNSLDLNPVDMESSAGTSLPNNNTDVAEW